MKQKNIVATLYLKDGHAVRSMTDFTPVDDNPYLADYYKDMERWSFNLQIYFLNKRFHDVVEISRSEQTVKLQL